MTSRRAARTIVNIHHAPHQAYDLEGPVQPDMSWLPLSGDSNGNGCYVMRMQPGAETLEHTHEGVEDYLILEGDLIESDGTVLGPGDFVSYRAGTTHSSRTTTGCLLIAFEWDRPRRSP